MGDKKTKIQSRAYVRTLLVDDSPLVLKELSLFLKRYEIFEVVGTAVNGRQALQSVLALEPNLIFMDVDIPYLNGIEATRLIKQFNNPPMVIVVTSDDSPTCREAAKIAGANGFISKNGTVTIRSQLESVLGELFDFGC
jgi:DNA-binding NarL/FixJ family response regulator